MPISVDILHARFVGAFSVMPARGIPTADLAAAATTLDTLLPDAYAQFLRIHGPLYTPGVLRRLAAVGFDHPDLRRFFAPAELVDATRVLHQSDACRDFIVFAADCMGNPFCFARRAPGQPESPVYFVDRNTGEPLEVEPSFNALLQWYVTNLAAPAPAPSAAD